MARRKKDFEISKDDLAYEEPIDEVCFTDYIPPSKDAIAIFNFTDDAKEENLILTKVNTESCDERFLFNDEPIKDNRCKRQPNGITPPVDGETFNIHRTYCLRKSTLRKLNRIKAESSDVNLYMNTIIDNSICHYYDFVIKK